MVIVSISHNSSFNIYSASRFICTLVSPSSRIPYLRFPISRTKIQHYHDRQFERKRVLSIAFEACCSLMKCPRRPLIVSRCHGNRFKTKCHRQRLRRHTHHLPLNARWCANTGTLSLQDHTGLMCNVLYR